MHFEGYGLSFSLRGEGDHDRWVPPGFSRVSGGADVEHEFEVVVTEHGAWHVLEAGAPFGGGAGRLDAWNALSIRLATLVTETGRTVLHAGAAVAGGRAVVVAGDSGSGKSTLVAALAERGAVYMSDEIVVVDDDCLAHPWPKPLSMKQGGPWSPGLREPPSVAGAPAAIAAVLLLEWRAGACAVTPLAPGEAVLRLLPTTLTARSPALLDHLARVVSMTSVQHGVRGEASAAADCVMRRVG